MDYLAIREGSLCLLLQEFQLHTYRRKKETIIFKSFYRVRYGYLPGWMMDHYGRLDDIVVSQVRNVFTRLDHYVRIYLSG